MNAYIVEESRTRIYPKWKPAAWNIYEKIIKKEETSTCKQEGWHDKLYKILMKPHPSFEEFCKVLMGEWVKIDVELDHLASGYTRNSFHTIIVYLDAMAVASKK